VFPIPRQDAGVGARLVEDRAGLGKPRDHTLDETAVKLH
jgi:hypothetical protein